MGRRRRHQLPPSSCSSASSVWHLAVGLPLLLSLTLILLSRPTSALRTVPNSPCESVCNSADFGTLEDDIVCLDDNYLSTTIGRAFRSCVGCGLNSTAIGPDGTTDVEYALLDLRFTLSTCMFAFPIQRVSISSPCQVTCQPLSAAIGYDLTNDSTNTSPGLGFCTAGQFDDTTINNCAFCYGLIPQQLFMANFLQALHIACRDPPTPGDQFFPNAIAIFNESVIAGPAPPSTAGNSHGGLHGWKLALAIALPTVGSLVLIAGGCFGCFVFTRDRRRRMAESGRMSRLQQSWNGDVSSGGYSDVDHYKAEEHAMSGGVGNGWAAHPQPQPQMHEMDHMAPVSVARHLHSPEVEEGEVTPLQANGPGEDQIQDPNLHDRFFGRDPHDAEVGTAVPMTPGHYQEQSYYQPHQQEQQHEQEYYEPEREGEGEEQEQHYYPPPPGPHQQKQQRQEEIAHAEGSSVGSPRSQAGPSYKERIQRGEGQDESGDWI